jgi:hypothetical protein
MKTDTRWLIWSHEHKAWWRPNHVGYCHKRSDAGRYTFAEACVIVDSANCYRTHEPNEAMVPATEDV